MAVDYSQGSELDSLLLLSRWGIRLDLDRRTAELCEQVIDWMGQRLTRVRALQGKRRTVGVVLCY